MSTTTPSVATVPVPPLATLRELFIFRVLREGLAGVPAHESWSALSHPRTGGWTMRQMLTRTLDAAPALQVPVDPATLAVNLQVETVHGLPTAWLDCDPPHRDGQAARVLLVWPSALEGATDRGLTLPWILTMGAGAGPLLLWRVDVPNAPGVQLGEIHDTMTRGQVVGLVRRTLNAWIAGETETGEAMEDGASPAEPA